MFVDDHELADSLPDYDSDLERSDDDEDEEDALASVGTEDEDDDDSDDDVVAEREAEMEDDELSGGEESEAVDEEEADNEDEPDGGDPDPDADDEQGGADIAAPAPPGREAEEEGNTSNEGTDAFDVDTELGPKDATEAGSDDDDAANRVHKKRRVDPVKERRKRVQQHYNQDATLSAPTSLQMLKLVSGRTGSHIALDLIWQAVLGVTDQHQRQRLPEDEYDAYCEQLHLALADHLSSEKGKYTVGEGEFEVVVPGAQMGHIESGKEFRFFLFRHWALFDAMCFSPYVAAKLAVWQSHGTGRLQELLAKMGVPLEQCKQSYNFMAPVMKDHFRRQVVGPVAKEYGFNDPEVTCGSFFRYNSFKNPVAACDIVHAASALVEVYKTVDEGDDKTTEVSRLRAFDEAYDCLGMNAEEKLKKGIQLSISLQKMIVRKASGLLEDHLQITKLKNLYFVNVNSSGVHDKASGPDRSSDVGAQTKADQHGQDAIDAPFSRPMVLVRLGQYIMDVKLSMPKKERGWVGKRALPLILIGEERSGKCLVVGISPLQSTIGRAALSDDNDDKDRERVAALSNFNLFFRLAANEVAREVGASYRSDAFDANVIELPREISPGDFVYTLSSVLNAAAL